MTKLGYYTPFMILSSILTSIAAGLLTTFTPSISSGRYIGYQILFGAGLGCGVQQSSLAAQTVLPRIDVPTGASLMFFAQQFGGSVFISIAQNVFTNKLVAGLESHGVSPEQVVNTGATDIYSVVPKEFLKEVLSVYNGALVGAFRVGLAMACLSIVAALMMEWRSTKKGGFDGPGPVKEEKPVEEGAI